MCRAFSLSFLYLLHEVLQTEAYSEVVFIVQRKNWRRRVGIEPTVPLSKDIWI